MTSQGPPDDQPKAFSHLDVAGRAWMVDVGDKAVTLRSARASGTVHMSEETLERIMEQAVKKGDVLAVARVAGILAAKRTADLIPLCHPLPLTNVQVALTLDRALPGVRAEATVTTVAATGVEMEALTAVAIALLTVYDMAKSVDKGMRIDEVHLVEKTGGKSGPYRAPARRR